MAHHGQDVLREICGIAGLCTMLHRAGHFAVHKAKCLLNLLVHSSGALKLLGGGVHVDSILARQIIARYDWGKRFH